MESSKIILKTSQKDLMQNHSVDPRADFRREAEENITLGSKAAGGNDKIILTEESDDPLCKLPKYATRQEPFADAVEQRRSRGRRASGAYGPVRPEDRKFVTRQSMPLSHIELVPAEILTENHRLVYVDGRPMRLLLPEDAKVRTSVEDKIHLPRFAEEIARSIAEARRRMSPEEDIYRKCSTPEMDQMMISIE